MHTVLSSSNQLRASRWTCCFLLGRGALERATWAIVLAVAFVLQGCVASSKVMAKAPPGSALAPAGSAATVVFIRSSGLGSMITFMIIDQNGRFLGEATAGAHFVTQLPPGEYLFIAEGENTAVMHANLGPERTYYVEVDPKMGVFSARVGLEPIKPGGDAWKKLGGMLSETTRFVPLQQEGQAEVDKTPDVIKKRIANAKEKWAGYSAEERTELSLQPADGAAGEATAGAAQPPAAGAAPMPGPAVPVPSAAPSQVPAEPVKPVSKPGPGA